MTIFDLTPDDVRLFAKSWIDERSEENVETVDENVTLYCILATRAKIWEFVLIALALTDSQDDIDWIAVGPLQTYVNRFGEDVFDEMESELESNKALQSAVKMLLAPPGASDAATRLKLMQNR